MLQPLPVGGFRWMLDNELDGLVNRLQLPVDHANHVGVDNELGYILEVDLDYPASLHDEHNDFPMAPEKVRITESMLSEYCRTFDDVEFKPSEKLVPNLNKKTQYVIHYRNLQLYVRLGMVVSKVHRVLEFRQKDWMSQYINLNTSLRKKAESTFEKDFFKLMNNAVYGNLILIYLF